MSQTTDIMDIFVSEEDDASLEADQFVVDELSTPPLVAQRLKAAIGHAGGLRDVAARAGVKIHMINRFLRGQEVKQRPLVALADACSVSVEWLATGRGSMRRQEQPVATERPTEANIAAVRNAITPPQKSPPETTTFRDQIDFLRLVNCIHHFDAFEASHGNHPSLIVRLKVGFELYDSGFRPAPPPPPADLPETDPAPSPGFKNMRVPE